MSEETKWRPIESAPKNFPILGWSQGWGMAMVEWRRGKWDVIHDAEDSAWHGYTPTHWQLLPEPPQ